MKRLTLVLLVLTLLGASTAPAGAFDRFPVFDRLAAQVAGRSVDVRCAGTVEWDADPFREPDAAAYVLWRGETPQFAVLGPSRCLGLLLLVLDPMDARASLLNPGKNVFRLQVEGVFALAHESAHLAGIRSETDAECTALRVLPRLLATLGIVGERAADFQSLARRIHEQAPPDYREHPCT